MMMGTKFMCFFYSLIRLGAIPAVEGIKRNDRSGVRVGK